MTFHRSFLFLFMAFIMMVPKAFSQTNLFDHCAYEYEVEGYCPDVICDYGCFSLDENGACIMSCLGNSCIDLPVDQCPEEFCGVYQGCGEQQICYDKIETQEGVCNAIGYESVDGTCCEGLVSRCGIEFIDGTCDMTGANSKYALPICVPCGNGVCNQFENACNCPEDCSDSNDSSTEEYIN